MEGDQFAETLMDYATRGFPHQPVIEETVRWQPDRGRAPQRLGRYSGDKCPMRFVVMALVVLLPGVADAQSRRVERADPPAAVLPPIGLPLPEIGLPLAAARAGASRDADRVEAAHRPPYEGRPPRGKGRRGADVVYVVPAYPWLGAPYPWAEYSEPFPSAPLSADVPGAIVEAPPAVEEVPSGTLWLDLEPRGVGEVYVDGYLVGTADDLRGSVTLAAGPHRIAVRAPGYEPLEVDVRIDAGRAITYRRVLQPVGAPPAAAAAPEPIPRKPFYLIPGCYLGDVPPQDVKLPAGCDPGKATVIHP